MLHSASLQNLTEWLMDSPFFGSIPHDLDIRLAANSGAMDHEVKSENFSYGKNIVIVNFQCKSGVLFVDFV